MGQARRPVQTTHSDTTCTGCHIRFRYNKASPSPPSHCRKSPPVPHASLVQAVDSQALCSAGGLSRFLLRYFPCFFPGLRGCRRLVLTHLSARPWKAIPRAVLAARHSDTQTLRRDPDPQTLRHSEAQTVPERVIRSESPQCDGGDG